MINKISIIGAGRVGESTAQKLAINNLSKSIVLIDIEDDYAKGVALDIQSSLRGGGFDTQVTGSSKISNIANSDIIIITAGIPRRPGMDRKDVLPTNIKVIDEILSGVITHSPDAIIIMMTNPVDILTYHAQKKLNWPSNRVIGQAGVLDSMRMSAFIAEKSNYSLLDINSMVLGAHGDLMVPLTRFTTIAGIPVEHLLGKSDLNEIINKTKNAGAEIIKLKKTSSTYNAPSSAIEIMVDSIVYDRNRILPCITRLNGEYGHSDIAIGVPVALGRNGISEIIELELNADEQNAFNDSVKSIKKIIEQL